MAEAEREGPQGRVVRAASPDGPSLDQRDQWSPERGGGAGSSQETQKQLEPPSPPDPSPEGISTRILRHDSRTRT